MPVCTSSSTSSAPAAVGDLAAACRGSPPVGSTTPDSPWIGSRKMAAVSGPTAARSAATSPKGTKVTGPGQRLERGPLGRLAGQRERAHRAAVESAVGGDDPRATGAPGHLEGRLVRLGSGVGEEHLPVATGQPEQPLGQPHGGLVRDEVRRVAERRHLPRHRLDDGRVRVAEHVDGDAGDQVEIALAGLVPYLGALAAHQGQWRGGVRRHDRLRPATRDGCLAG